MKTSQMLNTFKRIFKNDLEKLRKEYNKDTRQNLTFNQFAENAFHSGIFLEILEAPKEIKDKDGKEYAKNDIEKGSAFNLLFLLFATSRQFEDYFFEMLKSDFMPPKNFFSCIPRFRSVHIEKMLIAAKTVI